MVDPCKEVYPYATKNQRGAGKKRIGSLDARAGALWHKIPSEATLRCSGPMRAKPRWTSTNGGEELCLALGSGAAGVWITGVRPLHTPRLGTDEPVLTVGVYHALRATACSNSSSHPSP